MSLRAAVPLLLLAACASCRGTTLRGGIAHVESAPVPKAIGKGAAPGDEHGALGFVPRKEARSFYSGSGGQLWYYLNLYYWARDYAGMKDLWIKAEVVESWSGLKRWPNATSVAPPPSKTTVEYWQVGSSGRAMSIDNHKDFWLASENLCAGAIDLTITLQLGRFQMRTPSAIWGKPRVPYVLDHRDYGTDAGLREGDGRFEPLEGEPINVWGYSIPWSTCPGRFVRSNWEELRVPEITLIRTTVPAPVRATPVLTDDR